MSLITVFSIDFSCNEFNIIVEAEDAGDEQEGLCHIDQQAIADIVNHHDLIGYEGDAAHDEQHRTGVLRDFKARVFHSVFSVLHHRRSTVGTQQGADNVTCNLENCLYCFVHNSVCF